MAKGIKRLLRKVYDKVSEDISGDSRRSEGIYSTGLASEGYNGGYRQCLNDVILALNGVEPNTTNARRWWA